MRYTYAQLLADCQKLSPAELQSPVQIGLSNGIVCAHSMSTIRDIDPQHAQSMLVLDTTV